jgi:hypothetical protein
MGLGTQWIPRLGKFADVILETAPRNRLLHYGIHYQVSIACSAKIYTDHWEAYAAVLRP